MNEASRRWLIFAEEAAGLARKALEEARRIAENARD